MRLIYMAKKPDKKLKAKKLTAKEQSARFIRTAREIDVDESGGKFERVFEKVVPPRKKTIPEP